MKKLLLLFFSLLLSFNSYGEEVCYAIWYDSSNNIKVILPGDTLELEYDELLTGCKEGDILNMSGFGGLYESFADKSVSQQWMATMMASYCDLSETQVIDNQILVCKLVDRDLN